jgi:hypothetical protein
LQRIKKALITGVQFFSYLIDFKVSKHISIVLSNKLKLVNKRFA